MEVEAPLAQPSVDAQTEAMKAKQGKVTGVIIPPPEIRAVADKTAQFVARNGKSFEQRILASEEGKTAKFNFMKLNDPYHAYYEFKIREFEEGVSAPAAMPAAPSVSVPTPATAPAATPLTGQLASSSKANTTTARATLMSPIARLAMQTPKEAPSGAIQGNEFSQGHPMGLSALDTDVIKLTAQFTAVNGRAFLAGLAQREQRNPQFDFLKPTHLLFSYFTSLVDAYARVLHSSTEMRARLEPLCDKQKALERSVATWAWNRAERERKHRESSEADAEKIAFSSIDWHDFVVAETIDFPVDELFEYPSIPALGLGPGQPHVVGHGPSRTATVVVHGEDEDMDMDMEDEPSVPTRAILPQPLPPPAPVPLRSSAPASAYERDDDPGMDDEDDPDTALKVVSNYKPRVAQRTVAGGQGGSSGGIAMTMVEPLSGKALPVDEVAEHMRVALLDPRWREEQRRYQEKQRDTGFAEGDSIAASLRQFARRRADIFGSGGSGQGQDRADEEEEEDKTEALQWDGYQGSVAALQQKQREQSMRQPSTPAPPPLIPVPGAIGPALPSLASATTTVLSLPRGPPPPMVAVPGSTEAAPVITLASLTAMPAPLPPLPRPLIPPPAVIPITTPLVPVAPAVPVLTVPVSLPVYPLVPLPVPLPPMPLPAPFISVPAPAIASQQPPAPPGPDTIKRQRQEDDTQAQEYATAPSQPLSLLPAEEFASRFPGEVELTVRAAPDTSAQAQSSAWGLQGQSVTLSVPVTIGVKALKELVANRARESGGGSDTLPANRFQIKSIAFTPAGPQSVFLKDANTLAAHNIGPGATLEIAVKSRR